MALTKWFPLTTDSVASRTPLADSQQDRPGHVVASASAPEVFDDFDRTVDDAWCLLMYAAQHGRNIDNATRTSILHARAASSSGRDETAAANLLVALTKLAADLHPVTADSIRASSSTETKTTIRALRMWTCILAGPIVVFSLLAFVSSSISKTIRDNITTANQLLVKLRQELEIAEAPSASTPQKARLPQSLNEEGDILTQLQQYASTVRAIDARARQLNWFVLRAEWDPFRDLRGKPNETKEQEQKRLQDYKDAFELPVGVPKKQQALNDLTETYQDVRSFAQDTLDLVSVYYGAIATCLLPVLYALLGTCAYLLRSFDEELRTQTFMPSSRANWARFLIAGIGGAVVGLFSNFNITQGASISPLAIAFLVGYAVDVFFSFLEGLLQAFSKGRSNAGSAAIRTLPALTR